MSRERDEAMISSHDHGNCELCDHLEHERTALLAVARAAKDFVAVDVAKRPTIQELEEMLSDSSLAIKMRPNGEIYAASSADLRKALAHPLVQAALKEG